MRRLLAPAVLALITAAGCAAEGEVASVEPTPSPSPAEELLPPDLLEDLAQGGDEEAPDVTPAPAPAVPEPLDDRCEPALRRDPPGTIVGQVTVTLAEVNAALARPDPPFVADRPDELVTVCFVSGTLIPRDEAEAVVTEDTDELDPFDAELVAVFDDQRRVETLVAGYAGALGLPFTSAPQVATVRNVDALVASAEVVPADDYEGPALEFRSTPNFEPGLDVAIDGDRVAIGFTAPATCAAQHPRVLVTQRVRNIGSDDVDQIIVLVEPAPEGGDCSTRVEADYALVLTMVEPPGVPVFARMGAVGFSGREFGGLRVPQYEESECDGTLEPSPDIDYADDRQGAASPLNVLRTFAEDRGLLFLGRSNVSSVIQTAVLGDETGTRVGAVTVGPAPAGGWLVYRQRICEP